MKVHKFTVYVTDFENFGYEEYQTVINQHRHLPAAEAFFEGFIEIDEDEYDDHELNSIASDRITYDKYFKA